MLRFLFGRLARVPSVLLGASLLVFIFVNASGDPAALLLPPEAPAEGVARLRIKMGLDRPLLERFGSAWWTITFPGAAITLFVPGANFLGDALRDALDPQHA